MNFDAQGRLKVGGLLTQQEQLSHVRVTMNHALSVPNATTTKIEYDDVEYDVLGEYDNSTYTFTPAYSGYYSFNANFFYTTSTAWTAWTELALMYLYINGSSRVQQDYTHRNSGGVSIYVQQKLSTVIWLNAGDVVDIRTHQTSGSTIAAYSGSAAEKYSQLSIDRLPEKVIATGELAGALELIDTYNATGTVASVTFSDIPGTYRDLLLSCSLRDNRAAEGNLGLIRFNGDTGSNYDRHRGSGSGSVSARAQTAGWFSLYDSANARASNFPNNKIWINDYAKTDREKWLWGEGARFGDVSADADMFFQIIVSRWRDTAAITTILLYPDSASWVSGTSFYLYGLK